MAPAMVPTDRTVAEYLAPVDDARWQADADTLVRLMSEVAGALRRRPIGHARYGTRRSYIDQ